MRSFSFKKGFSQLQFKDVGVAKAKIMKALGIKTRAGWKYRIDGTVEPKVTEAEVIESIFSEYGITEVWGEESYEPTSQVN